MALLAIRHFRGTSSPQALDSNAVPHEDSDGSELSDSALPMQACDELPNPSNGPEDDKAEFTWYCQALFLAGTRRVSFTS